MRITRCKFGVPFVNTSSIFMRSNANPSALLITFTYRSLISIKRKYNLGIVNVPFDIVSNEIMVNKSHGV